MFMSQNYDEFKRSLDALVNQAQSTARLGLDVAKDQVESLTRNPNVNEQLDEVRRNLQTMAREMETRAQELVHLASTYMQQRPTTGSGTSAPTGNASAAQRNAGTEPPAENEAATAAGAGTPQDAGSHTEADQTNIGEAPRQ
jgi:ElaB/YqjD/DUF883 family membrane-anchored ribosome-binding protein